MICFITMCLTQQERPGAVAAIELASKSIGRSLPLLVIGGDTLFLEDFDLPSVLQNMTDLAHRHSASVVLTYDTDDEGKHRPRLTK
jgi:hypothetical protein